MRITPVTAPIIGFKAEDGGLVTIARTEEMARANMKALKKLLKPFGGTFPPLTTKGKA